MRQKKPSRKIPEERTKDQIETLKAENRRLRKEVQQLRKEMSKMKNRDEDLQEILEEIDELELEKEIKETTFRCPSCRSPRIKILERLRGDQDYYICEDCSSRGPKK